ncbi:type II and III secretion system protein family protein [Phreatobacter aquaticus]|uniref:Type II and III secretion system protein family protein n=1 Tax=Phreatobacter aquaticus TaxID=2570229 RepID=A0A4D7QB70_9HYPH|nr:type II and III secretion system protein family protein [Phreatobacter aquaticus]QCK85300.1 type II and III secretion system protein family protein [Phreatobacter aquaticus]
MRPRSRLGICSRALALALLGLAGTAGGPFDVAPAQGQTRPRAAVAQPGGSAQLITLGVGKSLPIELPRDARDVIVANPAIANAVVRSARRVFLIGVAVGQTNVFFLDAEGRQIAGYDIEVGRDLVGLRQALRSLLPGSSLDARAVNDSVVVSGQVATPLEAQQAIEVAARLVGDEKKVVNAISVRGRDQVFLKVTVSEMQRNIVKQLGVNLSAAAASGATSGVSSLTTASIFNANGTTPQNIFTLGTAVGGVNIAATMKAFEEHGVVRTLAEPTLTSVSGEQARFLAGGEFPVPAGRDLAGNTTIEFKSFGVGLAFTPVVLSEGRISLRVGVEVSEIDNQLTVQLSGLTIRGLRTRKADTTVELPSGGTMVMAGLLQETTRQNISGVPGALDIPILGALFRSRDYQRGQTELVIMVTPYIARHVPANSLARPDDNFQDASDPASVLIGRLNRIYGTGGPPGPITRFNGSFGFIRD